MENALTPTAEIVRQIKQILVEDLQLKLYPDRRLGRRLEDELLTGIVRFGSKAFQGCGRRAHHLGRLHRESCPPAKTRRRDGRLEVGSSRRMAISRLASIFLSISNFKRKTFKCSS